MHALTSLLSRHALGPVVVAAALLAPSAALAGSRYQVVLLDGSVIEARNRPAIALGKVSFVDADSHARTLSVAQVNLAATRACCPETRSSGRVWDQTSIAKVEGRVQIVGESSATQGPEAEAAAEAYAQGQRTEASENTDVANLSHTDRLRFEIARLDHEMAPLTATDHQRTVFITRQRELQQELQRLLGG
jgi:hypothetical protein